MMRNIQMYYGIDPITDERYIMLVEGSQVVLTLDDAEAIDLLNRLQVTINHMIEQMR